ncbi:similar to Saccharomyces cerevisiae YKL107W Putative protein of unknown function [Maudiozyma saulgeensis]|uniref:NAD(P)-binding protein n=1 Tax=Maudiozyma saulgeensis TaxID=1789683 RepID=A0A1X7R5C2_9SACH|nr:similar to Saccharomyces cerevisiae YKL107W Putative protein of unknown function [Kazachstania saulgeensis]
MAPNSNIHWDPENVKNFDFNSIKVLIVGGTGGLGNAIATELVNKGSDVTVIGRTFRDNEKSNLHFIKADLSLVKNCEDVVKNLRKDNTVNDFTHVIFTSGIFSSRTRQATEEGIERDMAISYLSRYIILKGIQSQLTKTFKTNDIQAKPRVFVMGFPGNNNAGNPDDMNGKPENYNFLKVHMNTVAANEALVLHYAKETTSFNIFGLNPGIIKTNIRTNLTGTGFLARMMENVMSFFQQTPESYASKIVPLLVTSEIENNNGSMFDNNANGLLRSENVVPNVEKFWENSSKLVDLANSK